MSADIELQTKATGGDAASTAAPTTPPAAAEDTSQGQGLSKPFLIADEPDEDEGEGLSCGAIFVIICLSPFLLILFIFLALIWLFLLPFRSCMHYHSGDAKSKPPALPEDKAMIGGGERGDWFQSQVNGTWLYYRRWLPASKPKGILFVAHGFGEHISREGYHILAKKMNDAGFAMFALDHQGHGNSTGDRAFFESIDDVIKDYIQFIHMQVDGISADIPKFIFGHSMGGLIALSAAVRLHGTSSAIRGVVLSAPCLAIDPKLATPPLKLAAKVLSSIFPKLVLSGIPASYLSRNAEAVTAYEKDPLIWHGGARARVGAEMLREMKVVLAELHRFHTPILLLHGTKDAVVPLKASTTIYSKVGSKDKTIKKFDGLFHEMFEDTEAERFFGDILTWVQAHAPEAAAAASSAPVATSPVVAVAVNAADPEEASGVRFHTSDDA